PRRRWSGPARPSPTTVSVRSKWPTSTSRKSDVTPASSCLSPGHPPFRRGCPQSYPQSVDRSRPDRETAVAELTEGVLGVQPTEQGPALLAPRQRGRRRDAAVNLEDPALEDAVLGPRPRKVLDAGDL